MEEPIVVGIDIGTSKICTLVARVENGINLRILGVGIEPSQGIRKGTVTDIDAAAKAIERSVEKAERTSGFEISGAIVSLAGSHVSSVNSRGVVGISGRVIDQEDVYRALDSAQAVAIPHNREIIHVIQRGFIVDGQDGVRQPIGMHGFRLEVEAHIITAAASTVENLRQCVKGAGIDVTQFVLNPLAAGEIVLSETERAMGVAVVDLGAGTTDMAIYINGDVWHTNVLNVGGNHVTSDIAQGLRLPLEVAEEVKLQHGNANLDEIGEEEAFSIVTFGSDQASKVNRRELVNIIEARMEEIFQIVFQEIKNSGYDSMLPAGLVLTGGASLLPGIRKLATRITKLPCRIGKPDNIVGLTDQVNTPAFATSVGLLQWAILMSETNQIVDERTGKYKKPSRGQAENKLRVWLRALLP
ncbi:MAG: cell division protein FtsA [Anaerolineaceae bacterium]|jgi:cell division protein FtsA